MADSQHPIDVLAQTLDNLESGSLSLQDPRVSKRLRNQWFQVRKNGQDDASEALAGPLQLRIEEFLRKQFATMVAGGTLRAYDDAQLIVTVARNLGIKDVSSELASHIFEARLERELFDIYDKAKRLSEQAGRIVAGSDPGPLKLTKLESISEEFGKCYLSYRNARDKIPSPSDDLNQKLVEMTRMNEGIDNSIRPLKSGHVDLNTIRLTYPYKEQLEYIRSQKAEPENTRPRKVTYYRNAKVTKDDPLEFDPETGEIDLEEAERVCLDRYGRVSYNKYLQYCREVFVALPNEGKPPYETDPYQIHDRFDKKINSGDLLHWKDPDFPVDWKKQINSQINIAQGLLDTAKSNVRVLQRRVADAQQDQDRLAGCRQLKLVQQAVDKEAPFMKQQFKETEVAQREEVKKFLDFYWDEVKALFAEDTMANVVAECDKWKADLLEGDLHTDFEEHFRKFMALGKLAEKIHNGMEAVVNSHDNDNSRAIKECERLKRESKNHSLQIGVPRVLYDLALSLDSGAAIAHAQSQWPKTPEDAESIEQQMLIGILDILHTALDKFGHRRGDRQRKELGNLLADYEALLAFCQLRDELGKTSADLTQAGKYLPAARRSGRVNSLLQTRLNQLANNLTMFTDNDPEVNEILLRVDKFLEKQEPDTPYNDWLDLHSTMEHAAEKPSSPYSVLIQKTTQLANSLRNRIRADVQSAQSEGRRALDQPPVKTSTWPLEGTVSDRLLQWLKKQFPNDAAVRVLGWVRSIQQALELETLANWEKARPYWRQAVNLADDPGIKRQCEYRAAACQKAQIMTEVTSDRYLSLSRGVDALLNKDPALNLVEALMELRKTQDILKNPELLRRERRNRRFDLASLGFSKVKTFLNSDGEIGDEIDNPGPQAGDESEVLENIWLRCGYADAVEVVSETEIHSKVARLENIYTTFLRATNLVDNDRSLNDLIRGSNLAAMFNERVDEDSRQEFESCWNPYVAAVIADLMAGGNA
jgi:hypothetical protein